MFFINWVISKRPLICSDSWTVDFFEKICFRYLKKLLNPSSECAYRFFQQRRQRQQNVYQQVKTIYYSVYYFKKKVLTWRLLLVKIMGTVYYIQPAPPPPPNSHYWVGIILELTVYSTQRWLQWKILNSYNPCKRDDHLLLHCCREKLPAGYCEQHRSDSTAVHDVH